MPVFAVHFEKVSCDWKLHFGASISNWDFISVEWQLPKYMTLHTCTLLKSFPAQTYSLTTADVGKLGKFITNFSLSLLCSVITTTLTVLFCFPEPRNKTTKQLVYFGIGTDTKKNEIKKLTILKLMWNMCLSDKNMIFVVEN